MDVMLKDVVLVSLLLLLLKCYTGSVERDDLGMHA